MTTAKGKTQHTYRVSDCYLKDWDSVPVLFSSPAALCTAMELCSCEVQCEVHQDGVPLDKMEKLFGTLFPVFV